jgi:SpoVK/Ycf46/Vps4 family AAA+-type ATPase
VSDSKDENKEDNKELDYGDLCIILHNRANDLYRLNRFQDAIELYTRALEERPELMESRFNRGLAYTRIGAYEEAARDISDVIAMDALQGEAYYTRGLIKEYTGKYSEAALDYAEAHRQNYDKAVIQLGVLVEKLNKEKLDQPAPSDNSSSLKSEEERDLPDFEPTHVDSELSFDDFGGEIEAKQKLKTIASIFKNRERFAAMGGGIPRGVLLYGPPGTGKTHMARIFANECDAVFYNIALKDLLSVWFSYSEKSIFKLFDVASKQERAVVFLDEIDAITVSRSNHPGEGGAQRRVLSALLTCMDGFDQDKYANVMVLAATNMVDVIDPALKRPGRFTEIIKVDMPDLNARERIFRIQVGQIRRRATLKPFSRNINYGMLAGKSEGLVGDDIKNIINSVLIKKFSRELEKGRAPQITTGVILGELYEYMNKRIHAAGRIGFRNQQN